MDEFLKRCFYHSGHYDSEENFSALDKKLKEHEVYAWSYFFELNLLSTSNCGTIVNFALYKIWYFESKTWFKASLSKIQIQQYIHTQEDISFFISVKPRFTFTSLPRNKTCPPSMCGKLLNIFIFSSEIVEPKLNIHYHRPCLISAW